MCVAKPPPISILPAVVFIYRKHDELIERCRAKVAKRFAPRASNAELQHGIPLFFEQLIDTLSLANTPSLSEIRVPGLAEPGKVPPRSPIDKTTASHGTELLRGGFTVDQVVHD